MKDWFGKATNYVSRIFRLNPPPTDPSAFAIASGQQLVKDPRIILSQSRFYAGLRTEEKLNLFAHIHRSVPLAHGAVETLVKLCATEPYFDSGNPDVDKRAMQIWRSLNLSETNEQLLRQGTIFGFACAELIWDNATLEMQRVVVPPSPQMRKIPDATGVIQSYIQLGTPNALTYKTIPAAKILDYTRTPHDSFDYYGSSIYAPCLRALEQLQSIIECQVATLFRLGKPRFLVTLRSEGLTEEQFADRIAKAKNVFSQLAESTDVFSVEGTEVKIIGADGFGVRYSEELRAIISMILSSFQLPAALLNVVITPSVGTESFVRQQVISLMSLISQQQDGVAQAWNSTFWPLVSRLEGLPAVPVMAFERPRLLDRQIEAQAEALEFQNALQQCVAGIRSPVWFAAQCSAEEIHDPAALTEFIDKAREAASAPQAPPPDDVKGSKATDEKATGNKAI